MYADVQPHIWLCLILWHSPVINVEVPNSFPIYRFGYKTDYSLLSISFFSMSARIGLRIGFLIIYEFLQSSLYCFSQYIELSLNNQLKFV